MMQLINDTQQTSLNIRSLVCDNNGIVIAETVYRCMFCASIFDSLDQVRLHYHGDHFEESPITQFHQPELIPESLAKEIDYDQDDFDDDDDDDVDDDVDNDNNNNVEDFFENNHIMMQQDNNDDNSNRNLDLDLSLISLQSKKSATTNQNMKGGLVTCEVCGLTKYYSHISRRYGVFSCESCAKFFYRYSQKPVQYTCFNNGNCSLKIDSPGARCKSCLLDACLKKYILDPKRHSKIFKKYFNTSDSQNNTTKTSNDNFTEPLLKMHQSEMNTIGFERRSKKSKSLLMNVSKKKLDNSFGLNSKYRRMACRVCEGCLQDDCGTCLYCLDKPKFGGNDIKKQKCLKRKCLLLK